MLTGRFRELFCAQLLKFFYELYYNVMPRFSRQSRKHHPQNELATHGESLLKGLSKLWLTAGNPHLCEAHSPRSFSDIPWCQWSPVSLADFEA
jgi:hypothetical protein